MLLANGADVNARNSSGLTPLHMVVHRGIWPVNWWKGQGPKDVMEALLANGADVNAKDSRGLTPLHMAAASGPKDLVELLLVHNANVDAQDNDGQTPLFAAAERGADAVVELLLAHKADPCPGRLRPDECLQTTVARPDQLGTSRPRFWVPFPEIRDWNSLRVTLWVIGSYAPGSKETEITGDEPSLSTAILRRISLDWLSERYSINFVPSIRPHRLVQRTLAHWRLMLQ